MPENDSSNVAQVPVDGVAGGFGERLRNAMERAEISQVELADKTGISAMHINHFVGSRRTPSMENLVKLLRAMWWVDARELICGGGGRPGGTGEQSGASKQEPRQVVSSSEWMGVLAETMEGEAADCLRASERNGELNNIFYVADIVLASLARRLRKQSESTPIAEFCDRQGGPSDV